MHKNNDILKSELWPVVARQFTTNYFIFQNDNDSANRARIVTKFKQINAINSMFWPAQSAECNIIEII